MIADLDPYSKMKDSGVPWLGEVPEHWKVKRLRNVARLRVSNIDKHSREDEQPVRLCNYVDVYKHDRITPGMPFMKATATDADVERFRLHVDDVLITKDSESWTDIGVPSLVEYVADDLVSGYHLALLRPIRDVLEGGFLFRVLQSPAGAYQFHVEAKGVTRYGLSHGAIKSVFLPVPPLPEQAAIVRFLDYADRRIRRYIRAKQKLIKLLEEQKQAIIHRAVTRGLDPDVPLKDSGVESLGEVPEHWEVMYLGRALQGIEQGWSPVAAEGEMLQDQWAVLSLSSVRRGRFDANAIKPIAVGETVPERFRIQDGDLLLTRSNTRELVGDACVVRGARPKTIISDLIYRIRPDAELLDPRFLMYQILSPLGRQQIEAQARGSSGTMPKIAQSHIRSWRVLVPSLREQRDLVQQIDAAMDTRNWAVKSAEQEISLLREFRTRLIADVVTGKLDVRDVAARLPDEEAAADEDDDLREDDPSFEDAELDTELEEVEA